ncbi:MAG: hypothetical protein HKN75_03260, partial [Bacteroidia bacterium]|nr:hypothetical protein [Bacteroidia bacterium]
MDSYYAQKNLSQVLCAFVNPIIKSFFLIILFLSINYNSLYSQCTELPVGWENVVLNEVTGDGGNIDSRNDAIVELAGPPGTDIGGWVVTNGEWAVVLPLGTIIPADGVFLIGCEIGANGPGGIGSYAGLDNGLSCGE